MKASVGFAMVPFRQAMAHAVSWRRKKPSRERKERLVRDGGMSPSESLVVRLCAAMGWEYEVMRIERGFAEYTASIACWVWPGRPQYGQALIDSFRQGEAAAVCSTYEWTSLALYAGDRTAEDRIAEGWIERVCRGWLDCMYGSYWYPSKRIMNYQQGGRFPASSDAELELWLAARGC